MRKPRNGASRHDAYARRVDAVADEPARAAIDDPAHDHRHAHPCRPAEPHRAGGPQRSWPPWRPGGVGGRRGLRHRRPADDPARPGRRGGWRRCATRSRANAWPRWTSISAPSRPPGMRIAREPDGHPRWRSGAGAGDRGLRLPGRRPRPAGRAGGARRALDPTHALSGQRDRRHPDRAAGAWRPDARSAPRRCGG